MGSAPTANERRILRSWKEISAYLGVNVRTAQRWEADDKLPVHRLGSRGQGRPFGYADELDEWLKRGKPAVADEQVSVSRRLPVVYLAAIAIVTVFIAGYSFVRFLPGTPDRVAWEGTRLQVFDHENRLAWFKDFPDYIPHPTVDSEVVGDGSLLADIDGDKHKELLINYHTKRNSEGKLICFSEKGRQRWEFKFGAPKIVGERKIDSDYIGRYLRTVKAAGRTYILAVATHTLWFPSQVVLLDPKDGHVVEEYWHPGHILYLILRDIDRDGVDEVLFSAINNPGTGVGHGALIALKVPFSASKNTATGVFTSFGAKGELAYVLFPQSDVMRVAGTLPLAFNFSLTQDNRILVGTPGGDGTAFFYYLDFRLKLTEFRASDNFVAVHNRMHRTGLLDHEIKPAELTAIGQVQYFPSAPDGNSPAVSRSWTPPQ